MQQLAAPKPVAPRERKRKATPPPVEPTRKWVFVGVHWRLEASDRAFTCLWIPVFGIGVEQHGPLEA
jgi:hypothetical protein